MRGFGTEIVESAVSDICHTWRNITIAASPPTFPPAVAGIDYQIRRIDLIISCRKICVVWIPRPIYPLSVLSRLWQKVWGWKKVCVKGYNSIKLCAYHFLVSFCTHFLVLLQVIFAEWRNDFFVQLCIWTWGHVGCRSKVKIALQLEIFNWGQHFCNLTLIRPSLNIPLLDRPDATSLKKKLNQYTCKNPVFFLL